MISINLENPIKSYWEATCLNIKKPFKTINSDLNSNIVIIGAGYTGLSCAIHLAKKYNEDVTLIRSWSYRLGIFGKKCRFLLYASNKTYLLQN